ncbi:cytochrome P450 [Alicyclobacillus shizuokensis]|uniref:cytochrome P450 n=1 Tax=Alicyclobacillus shizuokensis TaxID=392014 RepID=UPI00082A775D|nr:cytochrome P450 [Alicyclobacillus shizuokensis]
MTTLAADLGASITLDELNVNPYPIYRKLRQEAPVCYVPCAGRWFVTRYDECAYVDTHPETFTARETASLQTRVMGVTMLRLDGAAHARLRQACEEPLKPRTVAQRWRPHLLQTAHELIDQFADDGEVELVSAFADPFAAHCLKHVLGLRDATDGDMQRWTRDLMDGTSNYADDESVWERARKSAAEIDEAVDLALTRVRRQPDGTIISSMVHTEVEGPAITREEIRANVKLIIGGGLNEPRDGISLTVWDLLTHPDVLAQVRAQPELFAAAVEESLRKVAPLGMYPREVAVDTVLAGIPLKKGDKLAVLVASANRDERRFARPDEYDITRPRPRSHLAFGTGPHYCLGAWLARQELAHAALPALFERLPGMQLDLDQPPIIRGWVFRGPVQLNLRWERER